MADTPTSGGGEPSQKLRNVYLPPARLDECTFCGKAENPKFCSSCAEVVYCSQECQRAHWPSHKPSCGGKKRNARIDIATFYPFLALMADMFHYCADKPTHAALRHVVLNDEHTGSCPSATVMLPIVDFPDGSAARMVALGEALPADHLLRPEGQGKRWWPAAPGAGVVAKLMRRVVREGYVPHVVLANCFALLAEMYTTDVDVADGEGTRCRLRYRGQSIADFGVAYGALDVQCHNELAYCHMGDGKTDIHPLDMRVDKGQDPQDHYWMYFKTVHGEEVTLDCGMYTFNMSLVLNTAPYARPFPQPPPSVPAHFRDRALAAHVPSFYTERGRMSVLRNDKLQQVARYLDRGVALGLLKDVFKDLTGRALAEPAEVDLFYNYLVGSYMILRDNIAQGDWRTYPGEVSLMVEPDPWDVDRIPGQRKPDHAKIVREYREGLKRSKAKGKEGKGEVHALMGHRSAPVTVWAVYSGDFAFHLVPTLQTQRRTRTSPRSFLEHLIS